MESQPNIPVLALSLLLPLLVMGLAVFIFCTLIKCNSSICERDIPMLLFMCTGAVFLIYTIIMLCVSDFTISVLMACIIWILGILELCGIFDFKITMDLGTTIIFIFGEIVFMWIFTFCAFPLMKKPSDSEVIKS